MHYLGDTSLASAAGYLAGLLHRAGHSFCYVPSDVVFTSNDLEAVDDLLVLSDYPARRIAVDLQHRLVERIDAGLNLLMIGGWESFQGADGQWSGTPLADVLPVQISPLDDRYNVDGPTFVACQVDHPITQELPWKSRPPLIGGFNQVVPKLQSTVLLTAEVHSATRDAHGYQLTHRSSHPLLVVHERGPARIVCLTTDLAPHWVGPLVDWGPARVNAHAPGAEAIEVGDLYAQFVNQLIGWTRGR